MNYGLFISKNKSCCCECLAPPSAGYPLFDGSQFQRQCDARDSSREMIHGKAVVVAALTLNPKGTPVVLRSFSFLCPLPLSLPRRRPRTVGATRFVCQQIQSDLNGCFNRHGLNEEGGRVWADDGMDD